MRARVAIACCVAMSACDVPAPSAPPLDPGLVVFAVLDPAATEQVVLLMESRASLPDTSGLVVTVEDPIVTSGERPVRDARVVLYGPTGDSAVAVEDRVRRTDRLGSGVYRLWSGTTPAGAPAGAYMRLAAGGVYRLRVTSPLGTATGTARIPTSDRIVAGQSRTLNLFRDTVLLGDATTSAAGFVYALRTQSGNTVEGDPQYRRALERRLILPSGGDDWAFAYGRERLRTGTRHMLTVTAADSNYFAYFSAQTDPFADRTGRTNLRGAVGVFGAVLTIYSLGITIALAP